jgi:hypothetical protein
MAVLGIGDAMYMWGAIAIVRKTPEAMTKARGAIVHAIRDAIEHSVDYICKHRWRTFGCSPTSPIWSYGYGGDRWSCVIAGAVIALPGPFNFHPIPSNYFGALHLFR